METKGQTAWDPSHSPTTGSWCSRSFPRGIPFLSHKVQSIGNFWHSLLTWSFLKVIKKKDHLKQNNKMEIVPIFSFQNVLMASLNGCSFIFYNWFRISYISDILRLNKYTVWKFTRHQPLLQDPGDTNGISVNCDCRSTLRYWTTLVYQTLAPSNQQKAFPDSNNRIQLVFGYILIADVGPIWTWELLHRIFRRHTVSPRIHKLMHVPGKERAR